MRPLRTLFMGTSDFAVPSLRALCGSGLPVVGVVTQPDKPAGRGLVLRPSPVKTEALARGLEVFQPVRIREDRAVERLGTLKPDLVVVAAYGQILPPNILALPQLACLNVHASLLPRYRGAAPVHHALLNGETRTGVTIMHMNEGLDEGDTVLARSVEIGADENVGELHDRLATLGAQALMDAVDLLDQGKASRTAQDPSLATYAPRFGRDRCRVDWKRDAREIHNQVRGLSPWPVAESSFQGTPLRLFRSFLRDGTGEPGRILSVSKDGIEIAAGRGSVLLLEVQPPGTRRMSAHEYALGRPEVKPGVILE